jgi:hypothetical protein
MTPSDVHAQLKVRYPGTPVPYATVKSGLAEEVVRPSSRIEREAAKPTHFPANGFASGRSATSNVEK